MLLAVWEEKTLFQDKDEASHLCLWQFVPFFSPFLIIDYLFLKLQSVNVEQNTK